MPRLLTGGLIPAIALAALPAVAQTPGTTLTPQPNEQPTASSGVTLDQLQQRIDQLQKQLDAIDAANGGQTPAGAAAAIQKQIDDLRTAVNRLAANVVRNGYGTMRLNGFAQVWVGASNHPDTTYYKTGGLGARLRRFRLDPSVQINRTFSVHAGIDFARASSTQSTNGWLQDFYLENDFSKSDSLFIGQLRIPLSEVGLHSGAHLPFIERPLFLLGTRAYNTGTSAASVTIPGVTGMVTAYNVPTWGAIRDEGVQYLRKTPYYSAQVAITEGAGDYQNVAGRPDYSAQFTGQVFVRPTGADYLQLGATGSGGGGYRPSASTPQLLRIREGASLLWNPGRFSFETEYMAGADGLGYVTSTKQVITAQRHGEYGWIGYDLGGYKGGDGYQVLAQVDYWDPGADLPRQTNYTLGVNRDFSKAHERVQLNYTHAHYDMIAGGAAAPYSDNDQLIANVEANW